MKVEVYKRLTYGCIVLLLAAIIFMTHIRDILESNVTDSIDIRRASIATPSTKFQNKVGNTIRILRATTVTLPANMQDEFCKLKSLSPKEAHEENLLLESIAWPPTPPLSSPHSLNNTSDPAHSSFTIIPKREGGQWHVGDKLEVLIKMSDSQGNPKSSGGDVLFAHLCNSTLGAGMAGQVKDYLNGSYSAAFTLLWEGSVQVKVTLVHPSEAVTELRRLNREHPDRIFFKSQFRSGPVSETTTCNVCLRPTQQPVCNYTDLHTGEPWFCYKPKELSCDDRINNFNGGYQEKVSTMEKLFKSGVNMKVSIPASGPPSVIVLPRQKDANNTSVESGPSGYYYQGVWRALGGTTVHQFNTSSAITRCLKGKVVHMYGDSTIRQWFEYFNATLPDLKEFNLHSAKQSGPFMALDYDNNIMVTYRCHGPPIRFSSVPTSELRYIANELDKVTGGSNTIVILGIWSHFSTFPIEVYIRRLQGIRRAVVKLLSRAPSTLVVIRTANPKALTLYEALTNSDWYSLQRDKVLRTMFKELNVHLVDAWEMVMAHNLPHNLHPQPPIIKNMINVLLSYICPKKGSCKKV
ncbi:NXPE family member 3 isoform X2 [Oreochromis niloticus]|uniref:NXPE family member 3 isoform X2 n=1 Tax=Oreochromis niloticus TaxID=8128 RepID=UPI00022B384C|nr:NXPE family member 3 isoform X2 [Oreochromis niloticus]